MAIVRSSEFKMRTKKPEAGNKYYITKAKGGWSDAITGSPTDTDCNVLSNCVGFAYGRFNEIGQWGFCKYLRPVNAERFIEFKGEGLSVGQTPKVGACMVWKKGSTFSGSDGAGHVAIVEKVISDEEVYTSESGWGSKTPFWNQTRLKGNGNWGMNSTYTFLGFIYNPAVIDDETSIINKQNNTSKPNKQSNITTAIKTKPISLKIDYAKSFSRFLSGTYKTTDALNLRAGAGKHKGILTVIPKGTKVQCYGYYTAFRNVNWYYVVYIKNDITYKGFVSSQYLTK